MKRDIYAYITSSLLILAFGFSIFLIVSDNIAPFTTQATVKTKVVDVVPEVSGYLKRVYVQEGQIIQPGDKLFEIDATQYRLKQTALLAKVDLAQSQWKLANQHRERMEKLLSKQQVSKESFDQASVDEQVKLANLTSAKAELELANLNLQRTTVLAKTNGVVTNLSFTQGMYASTLSPIIHLVKENKMWIEADFSEKGLNTLKPQTVVNVVYDSTPGHVYQGVVTSVDSAINTGIEPIGSVSTISDESRWIRPQQKIRVRVSVPESPQNIIAGSRASVMFKDQYTLSDSWMRLLSWMRYVY